MCEVVLGLLLLLSLLLLLCCFCLRVRSGMRLHHGGRPAQRLPAHWCSQLCAHVGTIVLSALLKLMSQCLFLPVPWRQSRRRRAMASAAVVDAWGIEGLAMSVALCPTALAL